VDPVQTHYFSENLAAQGIEPRTYGSVARNSIHYITEAEFNVITRFSKVEVSNFHNPATEGANL
jgi:hypothetical protein